MPVVTLTTDFGTSDTYIAQMKAVVLERAANCTIVDITHHIPPQNILCGAIALREAALLFPLGSVHLAVVDPGVGSSRRIIAAELAGHYFVLPDNGLLTKLLDEHSLTRAVELNRKEYWRPQLSHTFHGRDIMAPVAAYLISGGLINELGPPATNLHCLSLPTVQATQLADKTILRGEILAIDHFGNLLTNIPAPEPNAWPAQLEVTFGARRLHVSWVKTYSDAALGKLVCLVGSQGHLEFAVNCGSAQKLLQLERGQSFEVIVPHLNNF